MLPRFALALLLALAGTLGLSGCGVRGNLEAPPDVANDTSGPNSGANGPKPSEPPRKGFVLDPLLR